MSKGTIPIQGRDIPPRPDAMKRLTFTHSDGRREILPFTNILELNEHLVWPAGTTIQRIEGLDQFDQFREAAQPVSREVCKQMLDHALGNCGCATLGGHGE